MEAVFLAAMAGVLWSLNPPVIKRFAGGMDPVAFNGARGIYAVLVLTLYMLVKGVAPSVRPEGLALIYLSALLGPVLGDILYIKAIVSIGGGNAITIGYLYIFIAQLIGIYVLGEKPDAHLLIGSLVAFTGIYLIYNGGGESIRGRGVAYALAAAVLWGMSAVCSRLATQYGDALSLGFTRNVFLVLSIVLVRGLLPARYALSRNGFIAGFITGGLSFGVGMVLFIEALAAGGVSLAVLPTIIAPALARFTSRIIAGEVVGWRSIAGTLVTVAGIALGSLG